MWRCYSSRKHSPYNNFHYCQGNKSKYPHKERVRDHAWRQKWQQLCLCYDKNQNSKVISNNQTCWRCFCCWRGFRLFIIIRYLQYTSSMAADEVELPTLLLATHLYWPASDRWTPVIVKLWLLLSRDAFSREFAPTFNPRPFFVHDTLGDGFPSTTQLKTTFCPSTLVRPSGFLEISGRTEKDDENIKHCYQKQS